MSSGDLSSTAAATSPSFAVLAVALGQAVVDAGGVATPILPTGASVPIGATQEPFSSRTPPCASPRAPTWPLSFSSALSPGWLPPVPIPTGLAVRRPS